MAWVLTDSDSLSLCGLWRDLNGFYLLVKGFLGIFHSLTEFYKYKNTKAICLQDLILLECISSILTYILGSRGPVSRRKQIYNIFIKLVQSVIGGIDSVIGMALSLSQVSKSRNNYCLAMRQ